jgi:hypothetical protein
VATFDDAVVSADLPLTGMCMPQKLALQPPRGVLRSDDQAPFAADTTTAINLLGEGYCSLAATALG